MQERSFYKLIKQVEDPKLRKSLYELRDKLSKKERRQETNKK